MRNLSRSCIAGIAAVLLTVTSVPAMAAFPFGSKKKDDTNGRKLTPAQSALLDKAIAREKEVSKAIQERAPLVETYIQNMKPDPALLQIPASDQHFLGRVDFKKVLGGEAYTTEDNTKAKGKLGFFKNSLSFITNLNSTLHLQFNQVGFIQMILVDPHDFERAQYNFTFVRNDFLGSVPTMVFDVEPTVSRKYGRFFGRIWVERNNGNIVRFNGSFAGSDKDYREFYHFDSWRTNVQPNLWLPTSFYVEESDPRSTENTVKFKSISHVWGYALKVPVSDAENVDVQVEGATDVSNDAQDVSPLGAQREWVQQAEDNVINRLYQAGLLDAPSDFDKILEQIANNILAYNNIQNSRPIRVRTLLTEPLESLAIGNTIVVSKGLLDTTAIPGNNNEQVNNLYAVMAFQVAHILEGHRLDTKYAFSDRLLFPDTSAFTRIPMHHTDKDNEEAAKKTLELLQPKELNDAASQFGLYLAQLQERSKSLTALNEPMVGDSLVKDTKTNTFWLQPLIGKGAKLDWKDLKQYAAMPLSSFLRFDPWTDQVIQMHTAFEPLLSSRDKMPFEITPVYMKLSYYKAPTTPIDQGAAAAAAVGGVTPPADTATPTGDAAVPQAQPSAGDAPRNTTAAPAAPASATGTSNPPTPQQ